MENLISALLWIVGGYFFVDFFKKIINKLLSSNKKGRRKKIYNFEKSSLIRSSGCSTKRFSKSREKKSLNKEYKTLKGDIVKSGGEQLIADYLYSIGVRYDYEKPFIRKDGGKNEPDFYLKDYGVYLEYFGLCGVPQYNFEMHLKYDTFYDENLKVIKIFPKSIKNGKFKQAIDVQFKKFTGYYLPKNYNKEVKCYKEKNNPNFLHYYFSRGGSIPQAR